MNRLNRKKGTPAPRYVHKDWPAFYYGPNGQSAKFNGPLEVPDGWHDDPAKVGDPDAATELPGYDEAVAAANGVSNDEETQTETEEDDAVDGEDSGDATEEGEEQQDEEVLTKAQIVERLKVKGVAHNPSWSKERLADLLSDTQKSE